MSPSKAEKEKLKKVAMLSLASIAASGLVKVFYRGNNTFYVSRSDKDESFMLGMLREGRDKVRYYGKVIVGKNSEILDVEIPPEVEESIDPDYLAVIDEAFTSEAEAK